MTVSRRVQTCLTTFVCLSLGQFGACFASSIPPVKVLVSVEALCIDSKQFVLSHLKNAYRLLGDDIMELVLVPYGKAHFNGSLKNMVCQHGDAECDANSYEQCIIDSYPQPHQFLPMIECLFSELPMGCRSAHFDEEMFRKCSHEARLEFAPIQACHGNSQKTSMLQKKAARMTPSDIRHVPRIDINGRHMVDEELLAKRVCEEFAASGGQSSACNAVMLNDRFGIEATSNSPILVEKK